MLQHCKQTVIRLLSVTGLMAVLLLGNQASAAMIEYQANLFGPGMQVHNCIDLDSSGSLFGDYNQSEGTLSNISAALTFVTITEGFIKRGFNNIKNYVLGTFNDNAPEYFQGKNIFVDLSRGAEYERTRLSDTRIREWGWALFYDPADYNNAEELFADRDNLKTVRNPYKTFAQLCPEYAGDSTGGYHGWCSAGVELYGNHGKPSPVPLPAAFYLLATGMIGLVSFVRKRNVA